jgi:hypothetical protein
MNKKTALTILIIIIILALIIVGYFLFFFDTKQQGPIQDFRNFFGGIVPINQTLEPETFPESEEYTIPNQIIPRLRKISSFPVSGAGMFDRDATSTTLLINEETGVEDNQKTKETVFRFAERATGHIYETTSRDLSQKRITNTTIPKTYQSIFSNSGDSIAMVLIENNIIQTLIGKINYPDLNATNTREIPQDERNYASISGYYLLPDAYAITKSVEGDDFVFLKSIGSEITNLYKSNLNNSEDIKTLSYTLNNSEWRLKLLNKNIVALNTKPSAFSQGFLYYFNPANGSFRKKLGNTLGLMSLPSPEGDQIIYSYYDSGNIETVVYNEKTGFYTTISITTFPDDKCVWSKQNQNIVYCASPRNLIRGDWPDFWYQGRYAFNDRVVKIDTENFEASILLEANSETSENLDIINIDLSPNEDYLMFINKTDLYLWSLDIK